MGRFYRTAKPTFVDDTMYKAPYEIMLNAQNVQDKAFDEEQKKLDAFDNMGSLLDYIDKDNPKRNEILNSYRSKADAIAEKINKNPALYKNYIGDINQAKREFEREINSGGLFEMDREAKKRKALIKDIKSRKNISEEARAQALDYIDKQYAGYGEGKYLDNLHIYDNVDENQFVKDLKSTINVDVEGATTTKPDGEGYMIQNGETTSYLTKERLKSIITKDPVLDAWKKEQLQTLERTFLNGKIESRQKMDEIYNNRLEKFIDGTIEKLNFKKITSTDKMSADGTWATKRRLGQSAYQFNQSRLDKMEDTNYLGTVEGAVIEEDDNVIDELYEGSINTVGPVTEDGSEPSITIPIEEKRRILDKEKNALNKKLEALKIPFSDFREKMKTSAGRKELFDKTGWSLKKLARQANYNKKYKYTTPKIENYNSNDATSIKKQNRYIKTIAKTINNKFDATTIPAETIHIDSNGKRTKYKDMTLGQAYQNGLFSGPQKKVSKPLPVQDSKGYYLSIDGVPLTNKEGTAPMSLTEAKKTGKLKMKNGTSYQLDTGKPLLYVKPDEVAEEDTWEYKENMTAKNKKYYVVIKKGVDSEGKLFTTIFKFRKNGKNKQIEIK